MKWIYGSACRQQNFEDYIAGFSNELVSSQRPTLDMVTRWNSTSIMLSSTIPYRCIFERLTFRDANFELIAPLDNDWEKAERLCNFLKPFYESK